MGSIRSKLVELKSIPTWNQFYKVALDTVCPLHKVKHCNRYVMVAIDHYSKWCETKAMVDHDVETIVKFLEDEAICRFGAPNTFLAIMILSGLYNLINYAKTMALDISTLHPNGQGAMGWWKDWSKLSNMDSSFCLSIMNMHMIGTNTCPWFCLDISVGYSRI